MAPAVGVVELMVTGSSDTQCTACSGLDATLGLEEARV
jgi:hypothetical protein